MNIHKFAFAIIVGLAGCKSRDASRRVAGVATHFLQVAATGKVKSQRMNCKIGTLGVAVFTVEFSELEGGDWKVTKVQVKLPNSKTVVLSDQFVRKMWSPSPEIDPPTATEKDGITTITISTGDGGESTSSLLEITKELTVVELM